LLYFYTTPRKSYVQNIGHDSEGTHCTSETDVFRIKLNNNSSIKRIDIKEDIEARKKIEIFFQKLRPSLFKRIFFKLKRMIKQ